VLLRELFALCAPAIVIFGGKITGRFFLLHRFITSFVGAVDSILALTIDIALRTEIPRIPQRSIMRLFSGCRSLFVVLLTSSAWLQLSHGTDATGGGGSGCATLDTTLNSFGGALESKFTRDCQCTDTDQLFNFETVYTNDCETCRTNSTLSLFAVSGRSKSWILWTIKPAPIATF
jgi:hypothetical protein